MDGPALPDPEPDPDPDPDPEPPGLSIANFGDVHDSTGSGGVVSTFGGASSIVVPDASSGAPRSGSKCHLPPAISGSTSASGPRTDRLTPTTYQNNPDESWALTVRRHTAPHS